MTSPGDWRFFWQRIDRLARVDILHSPSEATKSGSYRPVIRARKREQLMAERIPEFKNEDEEREFWKVHDSTEYLDWHKAERAVFPNLKPSAQAVIIMAALS
jgi:hypothetical protein